MIPGTFFGNTSISLLLLFSHSINHLINSKIIPSSSVFQMSYLLSQIFTQLDYFSWLVENIMSMCMTLLLNVLFNKSLFHMLVPSLKLKRTYFFIQIQKSMLHLCQDDRSKNLRCYEYGCPTTLTLKSQAWYSFMHTLFFLTGLY